jgi:hypothetical protein
MTGKVAGILTQPNSVSQQFAYWTLPVNSRQACGEFNFADAFLPDTVCALRSRSVI